ncbi:MAG: HlyD family efflux transporter periplasmic adaptor subunit, partial [Candidatus Competibacteraceae bacterium]|nr:HlyD family efflux transporter periplasmic adaptor subunit [Candidatus Competibacteraceae bacterium]
MKWYRWLVIAALVGAVTLLIGYGFRPQPVLVETTEVRRGLLQVTVEEEGKTQVKDRYIVSAPVAGTLCRIDLEAGDAVRKGQVLAEMEPLRSDFLDPRRRAEAEARVTAAQAALQVAQENVRATVADAEYAAAELQRLRPLRKDGMIAQDALEKAEAEARRTAATRRSAEFAVEVARAELATAQSALAYSAADEPGVMPEKVTVTAPVDGQVFKVEQENECVVERGQALLEIGDPRALEVVVDVLSADAVRIQPDAKVFLKRWGGEGDLEGRVRVVEPTGFTKVSALGVDEQRVWVIVDIVSPPEQWERLGDGYRVEASFVIWESQDVLQVPTSALFRHEDGWAVFVIEDERAVLSPV